MVGDVCMIKKVAIILLLVILLLPLLSVISYYAPYKYVENCFYSNKENFEQLPSYFKILQTDGISSVDIDENDLSNTVYNEVKAILASLQEQYRKDNEYAVFSFAKAEYDENGNVLLYMIAKSEKLKNGDGINSHDIRMYYLVYIDENYNGNSRLHIDKDYKEPFYGNWYTWSSDTYSG